MTQMNTTQQNQRGVNAPLSLSSDEELDKLLGVSKPTTSTTVKPAPMVQPKQSSFSSDAELDAMLSGKATTPTTTPQTKPVEASKPVAEPKKEDRGWFARTFNPTPEEAAADAERRKMTTLTGRGSSMTGKEVKAATEQRKAKYEADVASGAVVPFEQLAKDDKYFNTINNFMTTIGKKFDSNKSTREDFVKDYMNQIRFMEDNDIGTYKLVTGLGRTDKKAAQRIADGYVLAEKVPSLWQEGGQGGLSPFLRRVMYTVLSPTNILSLGSGVVAKGIVKNAGKPLLMQQVAGIATGGATDILTTAGSDLMLQKAEQDAQRMRTGDEGETPEEKAAREAKPFDWDKTRTSIGVLLSLAGTGISAASIDAGSKKLSKTMPTLQQKIDSAEGFIGPKAPPEVRAAANNVIDAINANMDEEVRKYVKENGKEVLNELGPAGPIADANVRTDLSRRAVTMAFNVMKADPTWLPKENEKISDAINRVFANIDTGEINDVVLESSIRKAGLTTDQFANATRTSQSKAAATLQSLSVVARANNKLRKIDPAYNDMMKELYSDVGTKTGWGRMAWNGMLRAERESKAFLVSATDTLARNIAGMGAAMTINTGVRLLEGLSATTFNAIETMIKGQPQKLNIHGDLAKTFYDTIRPMKYLVNQGLSREITELLTKDNPSLMARLVGMPEDTDKVSAPARMINVFATHVDGLARRSAFAESIDRQLTDVGMDMFALMKDGRPVPSDVVKRAIDDAMKFTFSYRPNENAIGFDTKTGGMKFKDVSGEAAAESLGGWVVKGLESIPTASIFVTPFARFASNLIAYQYRHSPLGLIRSREDLRRLSAARETGNPAAVALAQRELMDNFAKGLVGTAMLLTAVEYRENNQDVEWFNYKNDDGTVTDMRAYVPFGMFLGAADIVVKNQRKIPVDARGITEAMLGMKVPAGSNLTFIDNVQRALDSEDVAEEWTKTASKMFGDFVGRFTKPFITKNIYDLIDASRGESTIRDPNVSDNKVLGYEVPGVVEAGINRVIKDIPVLKEELAPAAPKLEEAETMTREGEFLARIIGVRSTYAGSDVAKEAIRLGVPAYKLFGRSTGDKAVDNEIIRAINKVAIPEMRMYINSSEYADLEHDMERSKRFKASMKDVVERVRSSVIDDAPADVRAKIKYKAMSEEDRRRVREAYAKRNNGKSIEDTDDYQAAEGILAELNARIGLNKGGFVQRRH